MDNNRLYFPLNWNDEYIKYYYYNIQFIEQYPSSPHRYFTSSFNVSSNDIAVDFGSAEGNWSLSIVEKVKKLYIFEPDDIWFSPLKATFSKWSDKVVIVKKFISDVPNENTTTIDEYFKDKDIPTLLKFDIEGFEKQALIGGKNILSKNFGIKAVICTYHNTDDEKKLSELMDNYGFVSSPSQGYMLFNPSGNPYELEPPYFIRGLIRCVKK